MAKKKDEPIITQTELLALAGKEIHAEILCLREEERELIEKADTEEKRMLCQRVTEITKKQEAYHMRRLEAVETMYQIQTGCELGLLAGVKEEEEYV